MCAHLKTPWLTPWMIHQMKPRGFFCVTAAITIQINNEDAPEINPVSCSLLPYWKVTRQWTPADPHPAVIIIRGLTWILSLFWFDVGFILAHNRLSRYLTVTRDVLLVVTYTRSNTSSTTSHPKITSTTLSLPLSRSLWACCFVYHPGVYKIYEGYDSTDYRQSREEPTLGNIPSRGEWLL